MSQITELHILKAEERALMALASRFHDQLNRLGVEEMALMSKIRSANEPPATSPSSSRRSSAQQESASVEDSNSLPALELGFQPQRLKALYGEDVEEEEEEEEEEDEEEEEMEEEDAEIEEESQHDQLTAFLKQLQSRVGGLGH